MNTSNSELKAWVEEVAQLAQPDRIQWCDGSQTEYEELIRIMVENGNLLPLNEETHPNCYLHRFIPCQPHVAEKIGAEYLRESGAGSQRPPMPS